MATPILLPAALVLFGADWSLLALADRRHAIWRDAEADEIVPDGSRTTLTKGEVVFTGASRVAVSLDRDSG